MTTSFTDQFRVSFVRIRSEAEKKKGPAADMPSGALARAASSELRVADRPVENRTRVRHDRGAR